jgi:hypothetical protein
MVRHIPAQSESKVASTHSKGLVKDGWKAYTCTEVRREWNEVVSTKNMRQIEWKQPQANNRNATKNAFFGRRSPHLCRKKASPKWPQLSPSKGML